MGKMQEMQDSLKEKKQELDKIMVEAEAGGGMVRVKANANRKILKIEIDPEIINKDDAEMMADLIAAAVNRAVEKAEEIGTSEMQKITKGMMPNIPGLSGMLGK